MPKRTDIKSVMVIGSGPIVIGQAAEFDYSGTQACKALRALGYEVVLANSNPATIMTDEEDAHEWRTPDNAMKDGLTVGAVAGTPWVEGDELRCDLLISDRDAIEAVKRGELAEVSAGYEGEITYGDGTFNGEAYQARQSDFRFNHILLLPSGAAGAGHTNHQQKDYGHG